MENKTSKTPRQKMPEQDPKQRTKNFEEVALGYTEEQALLEASRCLQCKKPLCVSGCPVRIDIPGFIKLILDKNYEAAAKKIKETNSLPSVCGRVCPQEIQCEKVCVVGKKSASVAIGRLERFAADYERKKKVDSPTKKGTVPFFPFNNKRVAVVGSGPAGLTVAGELVKKGYGITIFEALHKAGGVLMYGIPEFRLPKKILEEEIGSLIKLGVKIETNVVIGRTLTIDDLFKEGFDAVFIGVGAGLPNFLNIEGENLNGIYSSNEFLTRINLMKAYLFPLYDTPVNIGKDVAVFGGGNVAMDSARSALRLGPNNVYVIYRRGKDEMPARKEEIHHAEEEGIKFLFLTNPLKFIGDVDGNLIEVECEKMELGEPDASGRRRPIPIKNSSFRIKIDTGIVAIGNRANPLVPSTTKGLVITEKGYIPVDEVTCRTNMEKIYAGGDIVKGEATVILAMGDGRKAAISIDKYLSEIQP